MQQLILLGFRDEDVHDDDDWKPTRGRARAIIFHFQFFVLSFHLRFRWLIVCECARESCLKAQPVCQNIIIIIMRHNVTTPTTEFSLFLLFIHPHQPIVKIILSISNHCGDGGCRFCCGWMIPLGWRLPVLSVYQFPSRFSVISRHHKNTNNVIYNVEIWKYRTIEQTEFVIVYEWLVVDQFHNVAKWKLIKHLSVSSSTQTAIEWSLLFVWLNGKMPWRDERHILCDLWTRLTE